MFGTCAVSTNWLQLRMCACHPCEGAMLTFSVRMIPEGNPNGRVARKSGRDPKFKEGLTIRFWQPLSLQHLLPFIGTFEDVQVEVRVGVGISSLCKDPPLRGPLTCGSRLPFCSSSSYSSSSASSSSSLRLRLHPARYVLSLSLSLSLTTTSRCLCISLYLLCASPLECPCHKTETGAKLTAP